MSNKMDKLKWTKTRPTKPGFYFFRDSRNKTLVTKVYLDKEGQPLITEPIWGMKEALWAGPIPEPQ